MSGEGLHFVTDLALLGVNPINGNFKGVSMDRLYPSRALMYGVIGGQQDVIENDTLLDVLGVNLIMMAAGEGPVPSTLRLTDHLHPGGGSFAGPAHDILLLANEDAWPKAVLLDGAAQTAPLPFRARLPQSRGPVPGLRGACGRRAFRSRCSCQWAVGHILPGSRRRIANGYSSCPCSTVPNGSVTAPRGSGFDRPDRRRVRQRDSCRRARTKWTSGSCPACASRSRG